MDGNQRWSKKNNLKIIDGYVKGLEKIEEITDYCLKFKIKTLTVYALSSENFKRSSINILFNLIKDKYFKFLSAINKDNKVKINIIGENENLSNDLKEILGQITTDTINNRNLILNIVFNYGLQSELTHIVKEIIKNKKDITYENIRSEMYLGDQNDPDLLIRTGGYQRLSNFIPLNLSYTEFFFTKILWPDFTIDDLANIIKIYKNINKNYGL